MVPRTGQGGCGRCERGQDTGFYSTTILDGKKYPSTFKFPGLQTLPGDWISSISCLRIQISDKMFVIPEERGPRWALCWPSTPVLCEPCPLMSWLSGSKKRLLCPRSWQFQDDPNLPRPAGARDAAGHGAPGGIVPWGHPGWWHQTC